MSEKADSKKMKILDDLFMEAEAAKNEFGQVCSRTTESLKAMVEVVKKSKETGIQETFKNLKSFLESAENTMKSIDSEMRSIADECMSIQNQLMAKF